jgi:hypothetical protein
MKINDTIATVEGNAVFSETTAMTFDASSTAFIIRSLTNMYSDPYSAIVREYTSNAYDSHILAGQTAPVEVTTPTYLNANLTIRDFGVGMSRKELNEIYSKYGASTKRDTDDLIGGFGLGAKSALALVAQFTVVSVSDGKKNTVIISKDATGVGELNFLDEADTTEANGVTITIPIPDSRRLNEAIENKDIFLGWPKGAVSLNGRPVVSTVHNPEAYLPMGNIGWVKNVTNSQRSWYSRNDKPFTALIGPVSYKVSSDSLGAAYSTELSAFFNNKLSDVVLNVPNGAVDLTPSREELVYSVRTRTAIIASLTSMVKAVTENFQSQIASAEDVDSAFKLAIALRKQGFSKVDLSWRGIEIPNVINLAKDLSADLTITRTDILNGRAHHERLTRNFTRHTGIDNPAFKPFATWDDSYGGFCYDNSYSLDREIVVVIEANAPKVETNKHALVSNLVAFFNSQKTGHLNRTIYTVSGDITVLDRWFLSMITRTVKASEIMDFARAARKAAEESAKAEKSLGNVPTKTSVSIPIANKAGKHDDTITLFKSITVNSSDLPADSKFVIVPKVTETGPFVSLKNTFYDSLRSDNHLFTRSSAATIANGAIALLHNNGYTVVSLPENRNVERVTAALGENVFDFDTIFTELASSTLASLTVADNEWIAYVINGQNLTWSRDLTANEIETIDSVETRNWINVNLTDRYTTMEALISIVGGRIKMGYNSGNRVAVIERRRDFLKTTLGTDLAASLDAVLTSSDVESIRSYPLLANVYYRSTANAHVIEYLNLKDAAKSN